MTNTKHRIEWAEERSLDGEKLYYFQADSIFEYSEWFIESLPSGAWNLYLTRMDHEGTMPDRDFGPFVSIHAAQEFAVAIEEEWL